jgi:hypothetical protein
MALSLLFYGQKSLLDINLTHAKQVLSQEYLLEVL